jgi:hypothetical protein
MWMLVACNGVGEVVGYYGTQSTSLEEVKEQIEDLGRRALECKSQVQVVLWCGMLFYLTAMAFIPAAYSLGMCSPATCMPCP